MDVTTCLCSTLTAGLANIHTYLERGGGGSQEIYQLNAKKIPFKVQLVATVIIIIQIRDFGLSHRDPFTNMD